MKVLQVISRSPAYLHDGPPGVTLRVSKELVKRGHEVTIYTTDAQRLPSRLNIQQNPLFIDGIKVYHFRNLSHQLARRLVPLTPTMGFALKRHIQNFDLVHLREYRTLNALMVHRYSKKYNVPVVLQAHGGMPRAYNQITERQNLRRVFDQVGGSSLLRDVNMAIASTETEANQYRSMGVDANKIRVIPHAIDLADFQDLPKKGTFKQKYGLSEDVKIALYIGRINKVKGLDLLVDAFSEVSQKLPCVRLILTGQDTGFLSVLERKVEDLRLGNRVIFTGPLYGRSKLEAYRDADVYVLPSQYESFSNSVLEASACGTPVILTDTCAIAEVFREYGLVVKYDVCELSRALLNILQEDTMRHELARQGSELVRKEFTWDKVIGALEKTYYEIVSD